MLNLQDVTMNVSGKKILNCLNLEVMEHELFGLVGPELSGKTMACRAIAGVVQPDEGKVLLHEEPVIQCRKFIGYVPEKLRIYHLQQVQEFLCFCGKIHGLERRLVNARAKELMEFVGIEHLQEEYLGKLDEGARNKLWIAASLMHQPQVLILDEVLRGINPVSRVEIQALLRDLKRQGYTIVVTSDNLNNIAKLCDRIGIIDNGNLVALGTVDEIKHKKQKENPIIVQVLDQAELAMGLLRNEEAVTFLSRKDNMISIGFRGEEGEESYLLKKLVDYGISVIAFYREESDFDSIFLNITKTT